MTDLPPNPVLPAGPTAGVCLHITSLPGDYGIGDLGSQAYRFVDAMRDMQLAVWQFLPTGPTAYGDSPYQPLSTFAGNEVLIGIDELLRRGLLTEDEIRPLRNLPKDTVDYGALIPLKTHVLKVAAGRFRTSADSTLKAGFDEFLEQHDESWLHDYALYRILKSRHGERPWPDWRPEFVHRDPQAIEKIEKETAGDIQATKIVQFLFFLQWHSLRNYANASGIRFFGDMPICIALDSADAWAHPELLQIDRDGHPASVAGVPPDYFSEDGQLWGNPLYAWERHAATGFQWWTDRLKASAELADIVRIDHFRAFEAYWSVPASSRTARDGAWIAGPRDALFDAMKERLGQLPIVAENLGVITPAVEALRHRHGIPGMVVLQFDMADKKFNLADVPENCVCYTGTHDNDTTAGWFRGSPGDLRSPEEIRRTQEMVLEATNGSPETIHTDMIRAAFSTPARLAVVPMQDYLGLGSAARFNTPGTSSNNWRWRMATRQLDKSVQNEIAELVEAAGRSQSSN